MFKIEIKNTEGKVTHAAHFLTEEEGIVWVSENETSFGLDFVAVHTDVTEQKAIEKQKLEALQYLVSTDWYVIRQMETSMPYPQEIKDARALARLKVIN